MELEERGATGSDSEWLWELYEHLLRPSISEQWGWDEGFQRNLFETELPVRRFAIYTMSGTDVAALLVKDEPDYYYVKILLVAKEFQGLGIGKTIMSMLITKAELSNKAIRLSVIRTNDVTGFYEKLGFNRTGAQEGSIKYELAP